MSLCRILPYKTCKYEQLLNVKAPIWIATDPLARNFICNDIVDKEMHSQKVFAVEVVTIIFWGNCIWHVKRSNEVALRFYDDKGRKQRDRRIPAN